MGKKKKEKEKKKKEKQLLRDGVQTKEQPAKEKAGEKPKEKPKEKSKEKPKEKPEEKPEQKAEDPAKEKPEPAVIFRALGDESRMQILDLLLERERCGLELLESVTIVQSTLSHHMKVLTEAGLVVCRKEGKRTYYSISGDAMEQAADFLKRWSRS